MSKLYYTPPPEDQFEELRAEAIKIWSEYDDTYKYATGKIDRIKDIKNVEDNFMYMVAMFDQPNQMKLASKLSDKTKKAVVDRLTAVGAPEFLIFKL